MGNILIVEDDADTRWVLKAALESGRQMRDNTLAMATALFTSAFYLAAAKNKARNS